MDFKESTLEGIASLIETASKDKVRAVTMGIVNIDGRDIKMTFVAEPNIYLKTVIAGDDIDNTREVSGGGMKKRKFTTSIVKMLREEMKG